MKDIGIDGQKKLKAAKVLIVGAGGLGSPAGLYLAGAGIGTLGLVDADVVEESNLHRQVIHTEKNIGKNKTISAKEAILNFNHHINVVTYETRLNNQNAREIVDGWDIVMDGSDNAATRYLINDICMILKKPLVSGSALQLEGQVTVYGLNGGPCYRCMFPLPPPAHTVINCSDGGVLGMVPGLIGNLQSIEIVKIILGFSDDQVLNRRMIFFDAATMKFRNVKLRDRNLSCVVCGDHPSLTDVAKFDYDDFCQVLCNRYAAFIIPPENNITVADFDPIYKEYIKTGTGANYALIDVRGGVQYKIVNLPGSVNIPVSAMMKDPTETLKIIEGKEKVFIMCRRGNASKEASDFLLNQCKVSNIVNVQGGITEYITKVDPSLPLY